MGFLIVIIVVVGFGFAVSKAAKLKKQHDAEDRTFAGEHSGWDIYKSAHDRGILALDHDRRLIAVGTVVRHVERSWSDISAVEVEKNGQSIIQTNRGAQVMGAAVGAVLLGPLGLLVGSLSGSKRQKERVNELSLKILVDNRSAPVHRITFFRMKGNGTDARSALLKRPAAQLEHFHALVSNAIRSDDRAHFKPAQPQIAAGSSGEQIAKLWELRQAGALTEEEYASEKRAVLSNAPRDRLAEIKSRHLEG